MWTSLFLVLVFRTAVLSSPPNPTNVTIASENFRNVLHWSPGHGTPADTKYSVRYAIYGDSLGLEKRVHWRPVQQCTEISRTWCDLSVETSDPEHGYFARVRAVSRKGNSKWVEPHMRFDPMIDTEFGPPHVSVEVDDKYAIIRIEGPMRFLPHNHTPQVSMATLFPHMTYNLSIHNTRSGVIRHFTWTSELYKYRILDHGTEYCFSAKTKIEDRHIPSKHHSSAWHCVSTPEVHFLDRLEKIVLISTTVPVLSLCLLAAGCYVLHKYLSGRDQKSPYILTQPIFLPPPLLISPDHSSIIVISVAKDEVPLNKLYPKLPNSLIPNSGESYRKREWQIEAAPSASQNSSLQASLLNNSGENQLDLSGLREDSETDTSHLQINQNESSDVPVISSAGYASQIGRPVPPRNQSDDLPDDYGFIGVPSADDMRLFGFQEQEHEGVGSLHINWSPMSGTLLIPGLGLGIGHREEEEEGEERQPNLETVFVRQPSEEDALLGAGRSQSGQWDADEFMAKWDLIVSND